MALPSWITVAELKQEYHIPSAETELDSMFERQAEAVVELVEAYAGDAPDEVKKQAAALACRDLFEGHTGSSRNSSAAVIGGHFHASGARAMLSPWYVASAEVIA